jgi:hypothetical protein
VKEGDQVKKTPLSRGWPFGHHKVYGECLLATRHSVVNAIMLAASVRKAPRRSALSLLERGISPNSPANFALDLPTFFVALVLTLRLADIYYLHLIQQFHHPWVPPDSRHNNTTAMLGGDCGERTKRLWKYYGRSDGRLETFERFNPVIEFGYHVSPILETV